MDSWTKVNVRVMLIFIGGVDRGMDRGMDTAGRYGHLPAMHGHQNPSFSWSCKRFWTISVPSVTSGSRDSWRIESPV